jgi:hypothetical protein
MVAGEVEYPEGSGECGRNRIPPFCYIYQNCALVRIFLLQKWEDRLDQGIRFGKVLLLQNFDPQVTSEDVRVSEKLVWFLPECSIWKQLY